MDECRNLQTLNMTSGQQEEEMKEEIELLKGRAEESATVIKSQHIEIQEKDGEIEKRNRDVERLEARVQ